MSNLSTKLETIQFHNQFLIVLNHDNKPCVAMKPICENIGLDWEAQRQRIKRHHALSKGAFMIKVPSNGGEQKYLCLPLSMINGWLFGIDTNRVKPEIRPTLEQYQLECFDVLYNHFMPKVAQQYPNTISPEKQQAIREAVKNLSQRTGEKYAAVYARFYNRFKIPRYQALPAIKFDEAIEYLGSLNNELVQFTNDELCKLCWLCKSSELMRQKLEQTADGMIKLKSDYAASFYTMSIEYRRLLDGIRVLLESKTRNIKPKLEGFQSDNWQNVLMFIRND